MSESRPPELKTTVADRRQFLGGAATIALGCAAGSVVNRVTAATGTGERLSAELVNEAAQRAIDRGLGYLARRQVRSGANRGAFGNSSYSCGVAVASLGGLALMCNGSAPGDGKFGAEVDRCVDFVLSQVRDDGYIARRDNAANENMYGHGFAMLFLAQAYGMTQKVQIEEKLRKAVELTIRTQNNAGGWRYQPAKSDADLSITVCQIMGLRAARDAGIHVPDETREQCIEYVKKSQNDNGSFRYVLQGGHSTFAMTAAGVNSLYSAGIYDSEQVKKGLKYLMQFKTGATTNDGHFFYAHYYAVQAMWHAGGDYWNEWYPFIRDTLTVQQATDGSWQSAMAGPEFGTAMACIILQIPWNFLPVFAP